MRSEESCWILVCGGLTVVLSGDIGGTFRPDLFGVHMSGGDCTMIAGTNCFRLVVTGVGVGQFTSGNSKIYCGLLASVRDRNLSGNDALGEGWDFGTSFLVTATRFDLDSRGRVRTQVTTSDTHTVRAPVVIGRSA